MNREEDIRQAVKVLREGGVILYPTDTVWGLGCDATNSEAVRRIYDIKRRDDRKALICLVDSDARLQRYVRDVPDVAWQLLDAAVKPTTVILDGATSANISGQPPAQNYCDIAPELLEAVDYVCFSRRQEHRPHQPSSIIKLSADGQVAIIRK